MTQGCSSAVHLSEYMLCAPRPDFHTFTCQVIISFSPRDPVLGSEECPFFPPEEGSLFGGLKGSVAWEEAGLAGCWNSGCPGLGHVLPSDCLPLASDGRAWWAQRFTRLVQDQSLLGAEGRHVWAACQHHRQTSAVDTFQSPFISEHVPPGPASDEAVILTQVG